MLVVDVESCGIRIQDHYQRHGEKDQNCIAKWTPKIRTGSSVGMLEQQYDMSTCSSNSKKIFFEERWLRSFAFSQSSLVLGEAGHNPTLAFYP